MARRFFQTPLLILGAMFFLAACSAATQSAAPTLPQSSGACPPATRVAETFPGFPVKITMAEGATGDTNDPVNPTTTFKPNSTFHAVVRIENAPPATKLGVIWITFDTGTPTFCNSPIDAIGIETDGTRNLDFPMPPPGKWAVGVYQVQIVVNSKIAAMQYFSVK
jgi:hypothetical protein